MSPTSAPRRGSCSATTSPVSTTVATPQQVFRFYTAGDNDASLVADDEGFLYAAAQNDRPEHPRTQEVGQLQKLDPAKPDNPIVWTFQETTSEGQGLYGTPAVLDDVVIITSARVGSSASTATPARCSGSERWAARRGAARWWWTTCS